LRPQRTLEFEDHQVARFVYGKADENLRVLSDTLGIEVSARGTTVHLVGQEPTLALASNILAQLFELVSEGYQVGPRDVDRAIAILSADGGVRIKEIFLDRVLVSHRNKIITPKGIAQKHYVEAIRTHDVVFGVGPAGTGKTYLAMAMALAALAAKKVQRVILTRPAVEAGEKLGFLPGDLQEKVNPYLRPLNDALFDMMEFDRASELMANGTIEVAPLAFMRGRTLNDSFVILDEAQNTTRAQMKMFLTRLGFDSQAIITGDVTQVDLATNQVSGLGDAVRILSGIKGIAVCEFTSLDVVRHPLVRRIINAYEQDTADANARGKAPVQDPPSPT
jgi:phosphate starvation-inducible PhoH-like protein